MDLTIDFLFKILHSNQDALNTVCHSVAFVPFTKFFVHDGLFTSDCYIHVIFYFIELNKQHTEHRVSVFDFFSDHLIMELIMHI